MAAIYDAGSRPAIPTRRPRTVGTRRYGAAYTHGVRGLRQAVKAIVHEARGRANDKVDDVGSRIIDNIYMLGPAELHVLELTSGMLVRESWQ
jgi:hypothetical protein